MSQEATKTAEEGLMWKRFRKKYFGISLFRGLISIVGFIIFWEIATIIKLPIIGNIPAPSAVLAEFLRQLKEVYYWLSWKDSMLRILSGFVVAQIFGIPLGLFLGANKRAKETIYPLFEIMRPVPPLAWVPLSVIFWPTPELSMVFVTFLGAFFTVVLNIVEGVTTIDQR